MINPIKIMFYGIATIVLSFAAYNFGLSTAADNRQAKSKVMCYGKTCDQVLEESAKCADELDRCREGQ